MRLDGLNTLITGAGSGIGAATAIRFAQEGANVVLCGRREGPLETVAEAVRAQGRRALVQVCDVTREEDCEASVTRTREMLGPLDILFNNAGIIYREKPAHRTSLEEWEETFAVNTRGTFLMSKAALRVMLPRKSGSIVNNASCVGLIGGEGIVAYAASKGAVVLLTRSMALDHASDGIRVNCVCAGSVDTPMLDREMEEMGGADIILPIFEQRHPMGRVGTAEEVASAVLFLASSEASFVTGVALPVDGGRVA
jgi:NAD(P)-dependent dehydrogenase (short-subunit alcohol dehydrogenase family)